MTIQSCGDDDGSDAGIGKTSGYGGFAPGSIEPGRWRLERRGEEEPR